MVRRNPTASPLQKHANYLSIVLAYPENYTRGDIPYLFRSYQSSLSPLDPAMTDELRKFDGDLERGQLNPNLSSVARSTSAAPHYLSPMKVYAGNSSAPFIRFKDGGFGSNNPSQEVYYDIVNQHGGLSKNIGVFISIGTGVPNFKLFSQKEGHMRDTVANIKAASRIAALTMNVHRYMQKHASHDNKVILPYFRFDGGSDLGSIGLDDWEKHPRKTKRSRTPGAKTLEDIRAAMAKYIQQERVNNQLSECARLLVQRRRLRTRNAEAWQRYATGLYYVCDDDSCTQTGWRRLWIGSQPRRMTRFNHILDFETHLVRVHNFQAGSQELEKKLRDCQEYSWIYPVETTPRVAQNGA